MACFLELESGCNDVLSQESTITAMTDDSFVVDNFDPDEYAQVERKHNSDSEDSVVRPVTRRRKLKKKAVKSTFQVAQSLPRSKRKPVVIDLSASEVPESPIRKKTKKQGSVFSRSGAQKSSSQANSRNGNSGRFWVFGGSGTIGVT